MSFLDNLLTILLVLNLLIIIILAVIPKYNIRLLRIVALYGSVILFLISLFMWFNLQYDVIRFQFNVNFLWLDFFNLHYS